jgi:hypothetical protein
MSMARLAITAVTIEGARKAPSPRKEIHRQIELLTAEWRSP